MLSVLKNALFKYLLSVRNKKQAVGFCRISAAEPLIIKGGYDGLPGSSNLSNAAISSGLEWNVKITEKDLLYDLIQVEGE